MRLTEKIKENDYWDKMELNYGQNNTSQIVDKLGQLEDIEDELGIDLITLFKVLENGFWRKSFYYKSYDHYSIDEYDLCFDKKRKVIRVIDKKDARFQSLFGLANYGKIWALTREELL